ncbi:GSCFA domain-containing protein [Lacinutrix cladophorae]
MKLQTQIPLKQEKDNLIDYNANLLLLGSCFSENIGDKFGYFKFQSAVNPFGILFHPKAIASLVVNAIQGKVYSDEDVFFHNEQWHCYDAHSKLSNVSKEVLLENLNTQIERTKEQINKATHIIITLGTAWVYRHLKTLSIVANCHKVPQKEFQKELLTVPEIVASLENMIGKIKSVNSKVSVVFTVSPVRHVKDGFIQNTQSKAHLITAIHNLVEAENQIQYFPSYEIMLDELRDYRFYKEDMIHPNNVAVDYIWNAFQQVWISSETSKIMQEVAVIQKGIQHKPFHANSNAHQQFLKQLKEKQKILHSKFSHIVF